MGPARFPCAKVLLSIPSSESYITHGHTVHTTTQEMDPVSKVEKDFIINAAKDKIRVDGRSLNELRDVSIDLKRTYTQSSAVVSYGETKVCAITNCEIAAANPDRPNEGLFTVHVNLTAMGGREFEDDVSSDVEYELQRLLERSLKDNNTVDVESLCIIPGEKVFSIHCFVSVIDNNGNLFDAAVLAAVASLSSFRRPDYSIDGKQVMVYEPEKKEPVPICLHYQPICISFCILDDKTVLLDPNEREEAIMQGKVSLILNAFGELCGFHFLGGIPVSTETLLQCVKIASVKAADISTILKDALAKINNSV